MLQIESSFFRNSCERREFVRGQTFFAAHMLILPFSEK